MRWFVALTLLTSVAYGQDIDYRQQLKNRPYISSKDKPYAAKGDGTTNDATALQAAFNAPTSGGTIYMPFGSYKTGSVLAPKSNTTIICDPGTVIQNTTLTGGPISFNGTHDIIIDGCTLIASNNNPIAPVDTTTGVAVKIYGGASHITIQNCTISGSEFAGVFVGNGGASYITLKNNKFINNVNMLGVVNGALAYDIVAWGILTDSIIQGNKALSTNDVGISLASNDTSTSSSLRNIVTDNIVQNKYVYGILLYGDTSNLNQLIDANIIAHNQVSNIKARVCFSYSIYSQVGMGIYAVNANRATIEANQVTNILQGRTANGNTLPSGGISVSNSIGVILKGNNVNTSGYGGISVTASTGYGPGAVTVEGNIVNNTQAYGIWVLTSPYTKVINNNASNWGLGGSSWALRFSTSPYSFSDTNIFSTGTGQGIIIDSDSDYTDSYRNLVEVSSTFGIQQLAAHATLAGNRLRNNTTYGIQVSVTNGYISFNNNTAWDDRGGSSAQTYGFYIAEGASGCDATVPKTCFWDFNGNKGTGNTTALWNNASLTIFSAKGNQDMNDHFQDSITATFGGTALGALGTAQTTQCKSQGSVSLGAGGTQKGRAILTIDQGTYNSSNWGNFQILPPVVTGNTINVVLCNMTSGTLTPSSGVSINVAWSN